TPPRRAGPPVIPPPPHAPDILGRNPPAPPKNPPPGPPRPPGGGPPMRVDMPAPSDDDISSVSRSSQSTLLRPSGTLKPSATNFRVVRSNSRSTVASAPPRDR